MRLIDADALNKKKKYLFQTKSGVFPKSEWFIKADDLFLAKTIDAVIIVRCKDCKDVTCHSPNGLYCQKFQRYMKETDFCSSGHRKKMS